MHTETRARRRFGWGASAVVGSALGALIVYLIRRNGRGKQPVYPDVPHDPPPGGGIEFDLQPEAWEPPIIAIGEIARAPEAEPERELQPVG
jgi:hypothetical protein